MIDSKLLSEFQKLLSLDLLLFNIVSADLFLVGNIVTACYAIICYTLYVGGKDKVEVKQSLEETSKSLPKSFEDNLMRSNVNKCHSLVNTSDKVIITKDNINICDRKCENFLGVKG